MFPRLSQFVFSVPLNLTSECEMLFDIFFSPTKVLNALMLIIHAFLLLIADLQNHVIYVQGRPITKIIVEMCMLLIKFPVFN